MALGESTVRRGVREGGVWRNTDFVRFWAGEGVSMLGSQVTTLALPLAALGVLHASAGQVGVLRFVEMIPYLVCSLPFGVLADRARRRPLMLAANAARALLVAAIPVLAAAGALSLGWLWVIGGLAGVCSVLFDVSWMAYVPSLIKDQRRYADANRVLGVTQSSTDLAGPALAGVLIGWLGPFWALLLDAASYVVSLGTLLTIRTREPRPTTDDASPRHLGAELASGLRWVFGHRLLRQLAAIAPFTNFSLSCIGTLFLLDGVRERGLSAGQIGMVFSVSAVGALLGALFSQRLIARFPVGPLYLVALALLYASPLLLPIARGPRWAVVATFVLALLLCYFGSGLSNVIQLSIRQAVTPSDVMGRMGAAFRTLLFGGGALGALCGGLLGQVLGIRAALWLVTALSAAAIVPLALSPLRRVKDMPTA